MYDFAEAIDLLFQIVLTEIPGENFITYDSTPISKCGKRTLQSPPTQMLLQLLPKN